MQPKESKMKTLKSILTAGLMCMLLTSGHAQTWVTNGLVAYYPFHGDANDASGNGDTGSISGAVLSLDRFGNTNAAYQFVATNHDSITATGAFLPRGTNSRTLSLWFQANPVNTNIYSTEFLVSWGSINYTGSLFSVTCSSDNGVTAVGNYADMGNFEHRPFDGKWHNIIITYGGNTNVIGCFDGVRMPYYNGEIHSASWNTSTGSLVIGSLLGLNNWFDGKLDDIRIYNRALSVTEVAQLYALEAPPLPSITSQPASITTNLVANVSFSVGATGTNGVWYQWCKDGVKLPNATNSLYNITNVQQPYIGNYEVVVTGYGGSITSSVASLAINGVNSAIWQGLVAYYPFNGNANDATPFADNGNVFGSLLTVDRYGATNSAYYFNSTNKNYIVASGLNLPRGTNARTLSIWFQATPINTNIYQREDLFGYGNRNTNGTIYTVTIHTDNGVGANGNFADVQYYGVNPFDGMWHNLIVSYSGGTNVYCYFDGVPQSKNFYGLGPTNALQWNTGSGLAYMGCMLTNAYWYGGQLDDIRVYNRALSSPDVACLFASEAIPPSFAQQPVAQIVNAYDWVTFSVTANGSSPLYYQWRFNGTNIANATNNNFTIAEATQSSLGAYSCVISNVAGTETSSSAMLYLYPYIATPFNGLVAYWGQSPVLSVDAWGSFLTYQWYFNGVAISNATSSTLVLPSIQLTNAGMYSVVVSSIFGDATNAPAQVVVNPANVSLKLCPDLLIQGTVGYNYRIQSSTNLADTNAWLTVTNLILSQPVQYWDDTDNDWMHSQRYYRVLPGP